MREFAISLKSDGSIRIEYFLLVGFLSQLRDLGDLGFVQMDNWTVGDLKGQKLAMVVQEVRDTLHRLHEKKSEKVGSVLELDGHLDLELCDFFVRLNHLKNKNSSI